MNEHDSNIRESSSSSSSNNGDSTTTTTMTYQDFITHYNISVVASLIVILISFGIWRHSIFLPRFLRDLPSLIFTPDDNDNNSNINNNINSQQSSSTSSTSTSNQESIPFNETFSNDNEDQLTRINLIQNDNTYNRRFNKQSIKTVLDLKRYFYPNEINDGKRVLFISNGRTLIDTLELSTNYPNLIDDSQMIPSIHCIIRNQLTSDQVSNDPNNNTNTRRSGSSSTFGNNNNTFTNINNHIFETTILPRLSSTKSLYTITGLFLTLLWCLWVYRPIYFKPLTSFIMILFTVAWGFTFYNSIRHESSRNQNHQVPPPQPNPR